MILDNCPADPVISGSKAIELCFLPPNANVVYFIWWVNCCNVREVEESVKVEINEEDGDDTILANNKRLEKPTSKELRSAVETLTDFSFFMELEEVRRYTMKLSALVENELSNDLKLSSIKDCFGWDL